MASINDPPATGPTTTITELAADPTSADQTALDIPPELLAQSLGEYVRGWLARVRNGDSGVLPVLLAIVIIAITFQIASHQFLGAENLVNLLEQSTIFMVLAMAEIFALLLAEIDLSVGLVMGLGAVVVCELVQPAPSGPNWPWWLAISAALLLCSAVGALQGTLVARLRMPSFIVTLGGLLVLEGVAIILLGDSGLVSISNSQQPNEAAIYDLFWGKLDPTVSWIALAVVLVGAGATLWLGDARRRRSGLVAPPASLTAIKIASLAIAGAVIVAVCNVNRAQSGIIEGVPLIVPIVLAVLVAWSLLLERTRFGRYVYAIGGNAESARRAGVNVAAIRTWGFVLSALTAGIAGILFASWQVSMTSNIIKTANTYVLLAVAAAVIGGTSLFGGRGKTIHGVLGGLVLGGIYNGLYLAGVSSDWISVTVAVVLLAAGTIDVLSRRGSQSGSVTRV
jgi:D-xylose transport system permease protein